MEDFFDNESGKTAGVSFLLAVENPSKITTRIYFNRKEEEYLLPHLNQYPFHQKFLFTIKIESVKWKQTSREESV